MRKVIIYILSISILISLNGCTYNQHKSINEGSKELNNSQQTKYKIDVFYIGMKYGDLMNLDLYNTDDEITESTVIKEDKNAWDYGNKVIWTQKLCCLFDKDNTIYKITVNGDIPTSLGLKVGDTTENVEKLYGKYDCQYEDGCGKVLEYYINNCYLDIYIQDNQVFLWSISKYKDNYNGNIQSHQISDKGK